MCIKMYLPFSRPRCIVLIVLGVPKIRSGFKVLELECKCRTKQDTQHNTQYDLLGLWLMVRFPQLTLCLAEPRMGLLLLLELGCTGLATWLSEADFFIPAWAPPSAGGGAGAGPGLVGGVSATLDTRGTPTGPGAANIAGTQQTETFFHVK